MAEAELQKPLNSTGNRLVTFFLGIPILNSTEGKKKKIKDFILNWHLLATLLSQDNWALTALSGNQHPGQKKFRRVKSLSSKHHYEHQNRDFKISDSCFSILSAVKVTSVVVKMKETDQFATNKEQNS